MKYGLPERHFVQDVDSSFYISTESLVSTEDFDSFAKKLIHKIGAFFGHHASMIKYVKDNMKLFDDLNKNKVVVTVTAKDLSMVGNAIEEINEGLEKLRLGAKLNLAEFCTSTLEDVGITFERGRISIVNFTNGNWGEGKDKTGLNHPMVYRKTIEEFGWLNGAKVYAERFMKLAETTSKNKLVNAAERHFEDVKNAHARGIHRSQAVFDKQVAVDQINQIVSCRDTLVKFFFKQLCAIMKGANIQPIGEIPHKVKLPNSWTGK